MLQMLQSLLANVALLFIMHFILSGIQRNRVRFKNYQVTLIYFIIVSSTSISMIYFPIAFGEFRFDFRLLPLMLLAFSQGAKVAIPAILTVAGWRLGIGGDGAILGAIYGTTLPSLMALFFSKKTISKMPLWRYMLASSLVIITSDIAIIFVVPNGWEIFKEIFLLRFTFFLLASYLMYIAIKDTTKQFELSKKLKFYADHDPLTGLFNNRRFFEEIKKYSGNKSFIAMVDIDYFKNINDSYGHLSGDLILQKLSEILLTFQKGRDIVIGRYGGEEFIIFLNDFTPLEALNILENIRNTIENTTFSTHTGRDQNITVSIGFTNMKAIDHTKDTIDIADRELYKAKNAGRNRISTDLLEMIKNPSQF